MAWLCPRTTPQCGIALQLEDQIRSRVKIYKCRYTIEKQFGLKYLWHTAEKIITYYCFKISSGCLICMSKSKFEWIKFNFKNVIRQFNLAHACKSVHSFLEMKYKTMQLFVVLLDQCSKKFQRFLLIFNLPYQWKNELERVDY